VILYREWKVAMPAPRRALSGSLGSDPANDRHVGIGQDEQKNETADKSPESDTDEDRPVRGKFVLQILTNIHCKCRHWQWRLSRYLLECFLGFIGTAADAGALKHTRIKMSTISFRIYLLRLNVAKS
jgi:hypothetical protein